MKNKIPVYDIERKHGLCDQIAKSSATLYSQIKNKSQNNNLEFLKDLEKFINIQKTEKANIQSLEELIGDYQPDLAFIVSILVSAGWNLNDDVFKAQELWKARKTPVHKPINDEHKDNIILGHIVQSKVLDKAGNEILDNTESVPEEIDIEVAGVLYKFLPSIRDKISDIIDKASSGEIFVSMECYFDDFDYELTHQETNESKTIKREEATAFLTKYLRAYGGTGHFQKYKIGRVLKNMVFGGQGIVLNPANPDSVIKIAANVQDSERGEKIMDKDLQQELDEVKATLKNKDDEISNLTKELEDAKSQLSVFKTKISEVDQEKQKMLSESKNMSEAFEKEKAELQKQIDDMKEKAEKTEGELNNIKMNQVAQERFAKLSEVADVKDKEQTLEELKSMTDETFNTVLKYASTNKDSKADTTDDNNNSGDTKKVAESTNNEEVDQDVDDTAQAALDSVEEDDEPDGQVGNVCENDESKVAQAVASRLLKREMVESDN